MEKESYYKTRLRSKGQITIPRTLRERLGIGEGDDVVFYENEQGQFVVEAGRIIPPDQAWFWTERWQNMEREAQQEIDAGRVKQFEDVESAIQALNAAADAED